MTNMRYNSFIQKANSKDLKDLRVVCESGVFDFVGETFTVQEEPDVVIVRWDRDPDLFGVGDDLDSAIADLAINLDGLLALDGRVDLATELDQFIKTLKRFAVE